jgi:adenine-specific DNA glycosylase
MKIFQFSSFFQNKDFLFLPFPCKLKINKYLAFRVSLIIIFTLIYSGSIVAQANKKDLYGTWNFQYSKEKSVAFSLKDFNAKEKITKHINSYTQSSTINKNIVSVTNFQGTIGRDDELKKIQNNIWTSGEITWMEEVKQKMMNGGTVNVVNGESFKIYKVFNNNQIYGRMYFINYHVAAPISCTYRDFKADKINAQTSSNNDDSDFPWEVVIGGAVCAAAVAAIRKKLKKKNKNKKEDEEEAAGYILQLNQNKFNLELNKPQNLTAVVWKVTEKTKKRVSANFQISNSEKNLHINPATANGSLQTQLVLKDIPENNEFNISVVAIAEGTKREEQIKISFGGEKQLVIETNPANKTITPNTSELLTCYAKVVNEKGDVIQDLTEEIIFKPKSNWLDLSDAVMVDETIAINVGASNPKDNNQKPPSEVVLQVVMEKVAENEPILKKDLKIILIEPSLEVDIDYFSFPASKNKKHQKTFSAFIEGGSEETKWDFSAAYMFYDEKTDPLTTISIERIENYQVDISLEGPILFPKENEQSISKTLVVYAKKNDKDEPLERHITIEVIKEGLYIERGFNKENMHTYESKKGYEHQISFAMFKYDEEKDEIIADKLGLKNLSFELTKETSKEYKNVADVLEIDFLFDTLSGNVPYGYYQLKSNNEIPGFDAIPLKYMVKPKGEFAEKEGFKKEFTLNVKPNPLGKPKPTWEEAYEQCKYILNEYVPEGPTRQKLSEILEQRKFFLDAEGLREFRNRTWKVAYNLILAEGAEGYKEEAKWADRITTTLQWTEWCGDICFNALMAYYLGGGMKATAASMTKALLVEAINFKIYEGDKGAKVFLLRQFDKIVPLLMDVTKGRFISVENIEKFTKGNKVKAMAIFLAIEFCYNLYRTKSAIEAIKLTAKDLAEEFLIRKLTGYAHKYGKKNNIKVVDSPEVQRVIDEVADNITTDGKRSIVKKEKVLELMQDTQKMRTLKEYGSPGLKKAFENTRRGMYANHDAKLKKTLAGKLGMDNPHELKIDDFRTPGAAGDSLNTDRDYRVLRRAGKTKDGQDIWLEVPRDQWEADSKKIFGEVSNKPANVSDSDWHKRCQQECTDKYHTEASLDYSDHAVDPETGKKIRVEPNINKVKGGKGILIDPEGLGKMYGEKVSKELSGGNIPEAFAQAKKGTKSLKGVWKGYQNQGYDLNNLPDNLQKAMKIIEDTPANIKNTPEVVRQVNQQLNDLGYKGGVKSVMNQVETRFESLKKFKKPTIFQKMISYF